LNPDFIPMVEWALEYGANIWFVTNGSRVNKIKRIIELQEIYNGGQLTFEVSEDPFHDWKIQNRWVMHYAHNHKLVRNTSDTGSLVKAGRANELGDSYNLREECNCSDINVLPNGDVRLCGCLNAPIIGNVHSSWDTPEEYHDIRCINYD
ncbi:MAG: hypothetical protein WCJ57_04785, partial [Candidatus Falkowbacteria bacterium]